MRHIRAKIVLLGRSGAGKTSLVRRYISNEFSERHVETLGVRVEKYVECTATAEVELMVWDIAGDSNGQRWDPGFIAGAMATLFVVDQANPESFAEFDQFVADSLAQLQTPVNALLLNKSDLAPAPELKAVLQSLGPELQLGEPWQVSAKSGDNVAQMFSDIAQRLSEDR